MDRFQPFYKVYTSRGQVTAPDILEFHSGKPADPAGEKPVSGYWTAGQGMRFGTGPDSIFVRRQALAPLARQLQAAHPGFGRRGQNRFTRRQLMTLLARLDHAATFIEHARSLEDLRVLDVAALQERPGFHSLKGELGRMVGDLRFFLQSTLRRNRTLWVLEP